MGNGILMKNIVDNVEKVIIGKRSCIELMFCSLLCQGHVLIEDVPGVGKTSMVSALAKSLQCSFRRIQFTPDILPSDITGFSIYNQKTGEFEYRPGAVMSQIVLADEINRTSPKTQSSLLEVMEENQVTVDGKTWDVPSPFMVLATQNPVEYLGTYPLPEAQLDRFFMKITLGYPDFGEESRMLSRFKGESPLDSLAPVAAGEQVVEMQEEVADIHVEFSINNYIVGVVKNTRENEAVILGASPRASLCLFKAAQAWAYYNGRDFVTPDDVQRMALPVLSHRIIMSQESRIKKITPQDVINRALETVKPPVI